MKLRIAIRAGVGALVVVFWTLYISASSPTPLGTAWTLVYLTCPIALARHYALSFYFVLLVNAGTYALAGTVAEAMRRQYKHNQPRLISNSPATAIYNGLRGYIYGRERQVLIPS